VDIVRGFSLFGVLLANMVWTTQWFALTSSQRTSLPTLELDIALNFLTYFLVDFKFYTLFAMLFGLGFAMQLSRTSNTDRSFLPVYIRRLSILFFIGIAHTFLVWFGDILHIYAIVGFVLVLFHKLSDRAILRWAVCLALLTSLMPVLHSIGLTDLIALGAGDGMSTATRFSAMTSGDWSDIVRVNWSFTREEYTHIEIGFDSTLYLYLSVLWKFLIGFVIGRRMLLQNADEHISVYRRVLPWAAVVGIAGNAYLAVAAWFFDTSLPNQSSVPGSLSWIMVEVSFFALSMAYLASIVILYAKPQWRKRLVFLAPVGRMALTNYLLQSVIIVFLFYGVGFNLLGKVGASVCVILSLVIFGCQIATSQWWLVRFRFGPMEWVWRCLTYGKKQPFQLTTTGPT